MKPRLCQFLGALLLAPVFSAAQSAAAALAPATSPAAPLAPFGAEELDELLGPIALYPDALIALMLPASTSASEIVLAARFLQAGNDPTRADGMPWDDSVRALARYPETVRWMDENLAWTKQLGETFLTQPDEVMSAIQRLRSRALAAGSLFSTPQQLVVTEGGYIRILPAQPEVIFAPYYNPQVVYLSRPSYSSFDAPLLSFGTGFSGGWWLAYNLDWPARRIWVIERQERERYWREHRTWQPTPPSAPGQPGPVVRPPWHAWRPTPDRLRPPPSSPLPPRPRSEVARPAPYSGAPRFATPPTPPGATPPTVPPRHGPPAPANDTPPPTPARRPRLENAVGPLPTVAPAPAAALAPNPTPTHALTPIPSPAPAPTTTTPTPTPPTSRTGDTRSDQPGRNRAPREDRPPNPNRPPSEPRTRSSPPPAAAPAPNATPAPAPAPAAPAAAPAADSDNRRGRRTDADNKEVPR